MKLIFSNPTIPGTQLKRDDINGLTGQAFLRQVFFVSDGVMLSQIRKIAGIDGSTLQNWTKRGWVSASRLKRYGIDQVAHILLINMLRSCLQLDKIAWLLEYINGSIDDESDDIICDADLYDVICTVLDRLEAQEWFEINTIRTTAEEALADYSEPVPGAKQRLINALEIILTSYLASMIKNNADGKMEELFSSVKGDSGTN